MGVAGKGPGQLLEPVEMVRPGSGWGYLHAHICESPLGHVLEMSVTVGMLYLNLIRREKELIREI